MFGQRRRQLKRKKEILFFLGSFFLTICLFFAGKYFWTVFAAGNGEVPTVTEEATDTSVHLPESGYISPVSDIQSTSTDATWHDSFATFYDTFAFDVNTDKQKTSFYQDKVANALFFPPDYKWSAAPASEVERAAGNFSSISFNDFKGPYSDRRCIRGDCVEQKGNDLYYNNRLITLPAEIGSSDLTAVSIGSVGQRWLVGFTLKDGENYRGEVYYFNGHDFTVLNLPEKIKSPYFGLFGFGGEPTDFLVIYGAYQGQAYRVQGTNFTKIDKFFDIRLMGKGFKPEIIKASSGDSVNWYIYSTTLGRPHLIKLWQNRTSEIVGEIVYNIFSASDQGAAFKLLANNKNSVSLLARVSNGPDIEWKDFIDYGFKNNFSAIWTSIPIVRNSNSKININKIVSSIIQADSPSQAAIRLFFSLDGREWQDISDLQDIDFSTPQIPYYFLKLTFPAQTDKFYSPFIESLNFNYYCDVYWQSGS